MKKSLVFLLCVLALLLSACSASLAKDPEMLQVDHRPFTRSQYAAAYQYCRCVMRQDMLTQGLSEEAVLNDASTEPKYLEMLQSSAQVQLAMQTVVEKEWKACKLKAAQSDKELLAQAKASMGGEEVYQKFLSEYGLTESIYLDVLTLQEKTQALASYYEENGLVDADDEEAFAVLLQSWIDAAQITLTGDPGEITPQTVTDYLK